MGGVAGLADKPHVLHNTPSHIKNECTPLQDRVSPFYLFVLKPPPTTFISGEVILAHELSYCLTASVLVWPFFEEASSLKRALE